MPGVPRELAEHSLNVNKGAKPVKQGARRFGEKKRRAIGAEIAKLQETKFIREVVHTENGWQILYWFQNLIKI